MADEDLARAFVAALPDTAGRAAASGWAHLGTRLRELCDGGRNDWPAILLDDQVFVTAIAAHLGEGPIGEQLEVLRAGDLWLACACSYGDARAIAALEHAFRVHLEAALARIRDTGTSREDLMQIVRHRLFVAGEGDRPAIAQYSGRGPLAAWLRVTATRAAINAVRRRPLDADTFDEQQFERLPRELRDPELAYLERNYREAFREVFAEAVDRIAPRERTLLRQSVVHGLTVRDIGRMHGVHHATVARWLTQIKEQLASATREGLLARLGLNTAQLDSVMALIRSRMDVSMARMLAPREE